MSTLFNALLAGSLALLVVGQGLKKGFDVFIYSPVEAFIFLGLAIVLVPTLRGVVRTWLFPNVMRAAAHADRRRRRHRPPARAQARHAIPSTGSSWSASSTTSRAPTSSAGPPT